jgi:chromosome partitioning protein
MRIITLLNEKGGVGKTTLATHIATGLAIRGNRVILVDSDPQGHATIALGMSRGPGLYNLLVREASFKEVLVPVPPETYQIPEHKVEGRLHLIPSNEETRAIPMLTSDSMIILKRFGEVAKFVDVVVFDTSPTPSLLHGAIYLATNSIVYPTECEYLSLDGLAQSFQHRRDLQPTRNQWGLGELEVMGIVPTKFRASTVLHATNLARLQKNFGDKVWNPLALGTIWGEASARRRPVFNVAPDSKAAQEVWNVVEKVQESLVAL